MDDYFPALEASQADDDNKGLAVGHSYGARELWVSLLEKASRIVGSHFLTPRNVVHTSPPPRVHNLRCSLTSSHGNPPVAQMKKSRLTLTDNTKDAPSCDVEPVGPPTHPHTYMHTRVHVCVRTIATPFPAAPPQFYHRQPPVQHFLFELCIGLRQVLRQLCRLRDWPRAPRAIGLYGSPVRRNLPGRGGQGGWQKEPVEENDQVSSYRVHVGGWVVGVKQ